MEKKNIPPLLRGLRRKHYACVVADVPWAYQAYSDKGKARAPERHYGTMSLEDIRTLPVIDYVADDSFLEFWITGPFLAIGAHVPIMMHWGYEPVSIQHVWLKPVSSRYMQGHFFLDDPRIWKMGMGKTSRQNAEFVVLGRRGDPKRLSAGVRQEIIEPAREHSRKPDKFFQRVEDFCAGPRLELFGRQKRPGWTVRGNEIGKFK